MLAGAYRSIEVLALPRGELTLYQEIELLELLYSVDCKAEHCLCGLSVRLGNLFFYYLRLTATPETTRQNHRHHGDYRQKHSKDRAHPLACAARILIGHLVEPPVPARNNTQIFRRKVVGIAKGDIEAFAGLVILVLLEPPLPYFNKVRGIEIAGFHHAARVRGQKALVLVGAPASIVAAQEGAGTVVRSGSGRKACQGILHNLRRQDAVAAGGNDKGRIHIQGIGILLRSRHVAAEKNKD